MSRDTAHRKLMCSLYWYSALSMETYQDVTVFVKAIAPSRRKCKFGSTGKFLIMSIQNDLQSSQSFITPADATFKHCRDVLKLFSISALRSLMYPQSDVKCQREGILLPKLPY